MDKRKSIRLRSLLVGSALFCAACLGLTKAQKTAVESFSKAATGYSKIPSGPLLSYASLTQAVGTLEASTKTALAAQDALHGLNEAVKSGQREKDQAKKLTLALGIIETYAAGLTTLISEQDQKTLDANAEALGAALDGALNTYGQIRAVGVTSAVSDTNVFVGIAAGVAGLVLGAAQLQYLHNFVTAGNKVIPQLTEDVGKLLNSMQRNAEMYRTSIGVLPDGGIAPGEFQRHFLERPTPIDTDYARTKLELFLAEQRVPEARARVIAAKAGVELAHRSRRRALLAPDVQDALKEALPDGGQERILEAAADGGLDDDLVDVGREAPLGAADVQVFTSALVKIEEVETSIQKAREATTALLTLHETLFKAVQPQKVTLDSLIAQGQIIGNQFAAGGRIISDLNADGGPPPSTSGTPEATGSQ